MKRNIIVILFIVCINQLSAQTQITVGMNGTQVRTALNNNMLNPTLPLTTVSTTGVIHKSTIPWIHDFPGTNAGGGYTAAGINATRGKNLYIGKWSGGQFTASGSSSWPQTGFMNTGVGDSTLAMLVNGGGNTAIGSAAGSKITSGALNTAVGRQSLYLLTVNNNNTAVGESSLERLIDGGDNVAVGTNAGMYSYKGSNNTLLGYNAGYGASNAPRYEVALSEYTGSTVVGATAYNSVRYGTNNIAIGLTAMGGTRVAGHENIGIGTYALNKNKGNYSIGIGDRVGETDSIGYFNIYIGSQVARSSMDAKVNTIIGYTAGYSLISGGSNSILGGTAAYNITTGEKNTLLGRSAGANGLTTGSLNVFIGNESGYYETGSNKLFIDYDKRASEADARVKALLYGVFAATVANQRLTINARVIIPQISAALTDNTPTDTEIDTATGLTPATATAGFHCTIKDSNGTGLLYRIESDGTDWFYTVMTKAVN